MKLIYIFFCFSFLIYNGMQMEGYHDITRYVTVRDFEAIKEMIRKNGKHDPHRVYESQLPYASFDSLNLYLTGRNHQGEFLINPNEIGIVNLSSSTPSPHYAIRVVRKGDHSTNDLLKVPNLKEEHVYLRYHYDTTYRPDELRASFLKNILPRIRKKMME